MISLLLALAAVQAPQGAEARYRSCTAEAAGNPERAISTANRWRIEGGGLAARQCLGLAYVGLARWASAATVFEQAAREAADARDARVSDLWVQAGNAWLAGDEGAKARAAFDAALGTAHLTPAMRGEVHLDRARAGVALDDLNGARADLDKGLELVPADPFGWYLSSALALRMGQNDRAKADITKAVDLAPTDAELLLQAGTVAGTSGDHGAARSFYERAYAAAPNSRAGQAAQKALTTPAPAPAPEPIDEEG